MNLLQIFCTACDANCDLSTGCSVSGPGLCDTQCNDGFILVNKTCKGLTHKDFVKHIRFFDCKRSVHFMRR